MTAQRFALPQTRWLAFALVTCLAFTGLLAASVSAQAAPKTLSTINLCITKSGPDKGKVRFVQTKAKCKGGELRVQVVSSPGQQGVLGIEGSSGATGPTGAQGAKGDKGDKGEQGDQGLQGLTGDQGAQGLQGLQGPQGIQGEKGEKGDQGIPGEKGAPGLGTPVSASNTGVGTTASTTYTAALSGAGAGINPQVSLETGTQAMVIVTGFVSPAQGTNNLAYMGFAVSGATTQAAVDSRAVIREHGGSSGTGGIQASVTTVITDLTAGTNTFTLQYKRSGSGTSSSTFSNRTITVIPLG